jgi:hypothetical protein
MDIQSNSCLLLPNSCAGYSFQAHTSAAKRSNNAAEMAIARLHMLKAACCGFNVSSLQGSSQSAASSQTEEVKLVVQSNYCSLDAARDLLTADQVPTASLPRNRPCRLELQGTGFANDVQIYIGPLPCDVDLASITSISVSIGLAAVIRLQQQHAFLASIARHFVANLLGYADHHLKRVLLYPGALLYSCSCGFC